MQRITTKGNHETCGSEPAREVAIIFNINGARHYAIASQLAATGIALG